MRGIDLPDRAILILQILAVHEGQVKELPRGRLHLLIETMIQRGARMPQGQGARAEGGSEGSANLLTPPTNHYFQPPRLAQPSAGIRIATISFLISKKI